MKPDELGLPTIILPYPGPSLEKGSQDIFVYLRPETNGVIAESTILKVVKAANRFEDQMKLIYLANFPGEFIVDHKIVEHYYGLRLHFAVQGKIAFTPLMQTKFTEFFGLDFESANIIGAFDALKEFNLDPEALFDLWVPETDFVSIHGQMIKKFRDYFIVNYDIPALLHKNSKNTDIALMIFRTTKAYIDVKALVAEMHKALCDIHILSPHLDAARAFHYSKSPIEQLLDGISYVYLASEKKLRVEDFTFGKWYLDQGGDVPKLFTIMRNPIVKLHEGNAEYECNILQKTMFSTFEETLDTINRAVLIKPIIHHSHIIDDFSSNWP